MRFCWNDGFGRPLSQFSPATAKLYYDIGFRVVGVNAGGTLDESTAADIEHAKRIYSDAGLFPGPAPAGAALIRPDPSATDRENRRIVRMLEVCGKLGVPALQPSVGSMNPDNVWRHHPDNFKPKSMDLLVENVRKLAKVAADNNVAICPETTQWTVVHNIATMKEFVDRVGSPLVRVTFDFTNHMDAERVYDSGRYIRCAVRTLGDRIGIFHVKDVKIGNQNLVVHLDEAPMGTGWLDHEALLRVSNELEPWKTFSLEHIRDETSLKKAHDHIQTIAGRIGHRWTDPSLTRDRFLAGASGRRGAT